MDLLKDNVRSLYFRYLRSMFGGSLIMSIYAVVDSICIGRYEGPNGAAAVACMFPMWTVMMASGMMLGIGGSVFLAQYRGAGNREEGDRYFTTAVLSAAAVAAVLFLILNLFTKPLLVISGARDEEILQLVLIYMRWIALASPAFVLSRAINPFVSNDGAPFYATVSTMAGGIFNIFGDIFFVFVMDMGIAGAGLATALGQVIATLVLLSYFLRKRCSLKLNLSDIAAFPRRLIRIIKMGMSSFLVDISMGVVSLIFNNQIMIWLGSTAMAVYGVTSNLLSLIQGISYAVGESAQPIMSQNFGARQYDRISEVMKYAAGVAMVIGIVCFAGTALFPIPLTKLFMTATEEVLVIAPAIFRIYFIAVIFLSFNILTTYFYQSVGTPVTALICTLLRGIVICGILLLVLPLLFGGNAIWFAMPLAELLVFILNLYLVKRQMQSLNKSARTAA